MMKVLFLEDEPTIQEVLTEYMKIQNYEVRTVQDGNDAIYLLKTEHFDIAVLDIMVPGVSGLEVLAYIKENYPEIATIMLSALEDENTQLAAFNQYADDYVVKPVSPILLLKRMETILRRVKEGSRRQDCNIGEGKGRERTEQGLVLHHAEYQAYYDGKNLSLTLSEFLLLQVLEGEPNRAFTREQLILRIFNEDYIGNDRIIDAHVKNLRKKLPKNYIRTVIGVGYQFEGNV
ncbi:MAG: response regulator transcription factor [Lachnospiraceae bacterium]|nr:response regulator transcription factor [Lachnospiraceae bacterium]